MFDQFKQLKQLRDQAQQLKQTLGSEFIEQKSADGRVRIVMNGNQEVTSLMIDESLLHPEKKNELEETMRNVVNEATEKIRKLIAEKLKMSGGLFGQ